MIRQLQFIAPLKKLLFWSALLVFLFGAVDQALAQTKILADEVTYTSGNKPGIFPPPTVENPNNALQEDDTYARLLASPGLAIGLGSYDGVIELKFPETRSADSWSYVRLQGDNDLFRALLGGSLGEVLGDVLGAVLLGNQEITIDARMNANSILSRTSTQGFGTDRVRLLTNGDGDYYLAIKPEQDYDRIRITNHTGSLLGLGSEKQLDVYYAFYYDENGSDCGRPLATSFDGNNGLGLEVLDLDNQHLERAIDDDVDSYSLLKSTSTLNLNIANKLSQYFYFSTTSSNTSTLNIKLALGSGGLVNTDLLGAIEVILYNDNDVVYERSLQSGLLNNTDALNLLDSGDAAILTFAPGREFDRAEVRLNSPVGLSLLGDGVKIYDVQRYDDDAGCENPEIAAIPTATDDPFDVPSCATDLIDFDNVDFAQRAVDNNNESYATLYADSGDLLGTPTAGYLEMDLGQTLDANKTTYVRIGYDEDVLDLLLGGSLGLIADLANNLLLGNQYIQVEAKNGNTPVLDEKSSDAFEGNADGVVTIVEDNIGRYYLAITPNASYDRIRITNHVSALLPTGRKASLDVYSACFETGDDTCFPANFTSYKGGGVNLSVGQLSEVGVKDPYKAISENSSEYSEINLGIAGIAANVYQTIYFSQPSQADDHVQIRLMIEPSSALSLDLLGSYKIKFFNGTDQVGSDYTLQDGLLNNIDLLALFNSGGTVTLDFEPTGTFDRVDIGAETILELNVATEPLRIYDVQRYGDECPLTVTESPFETPSCSTELIASEHADEVQNLFSEDFDSYATLKSNAGPLLGINSYSGYVEMGYPTTMSAGTTSYIRIDFDDDILNALVSGSLGNVVSGLLNGLVLGNHYFEVEVKDNGTPILSGSSGSTGGTDAIRVVQDAAGRYYIAVTPEDDYDSIRITDHTDSAVGLLAQPNTMNVYGMCTELSTDLCLDAFATSYEYSGINLGVNDLGGAGVTNPEYVLDDNTQHYSEISNGTLGVGTSTKQWIYFNTVSSDDDVVLISFKTQGGAVDLDILGGLEVKAYRGEDEVATLDWQNGIVNGVNVLDLITNGEMIEVPFAPGEEYDRISVGIRTLVGVDIFPPIHLYDVQRCYTLGNAEFVAWKSYVVDGDASIAEVSGEEVVEYTIHVENTGDVDYHNMIINDELPEHTTYVSGGTYDNGVIIFDGINVSIGETETVSFTVKVDKDLTGVDFIHNVALVKASPSDPGQETYPPIDNENPTDPDDNGSTGTDIPVTPIHTVEFTKTGVSDGANNGSAAADDIITYTITVKNTGNETLENVLISDVIPANTALYDAGDFIENSGTMEATITSLGVDDEMQFSFAVQVDSGLDTNTIFEIENTAQVDFPNEDESGTYTETADFNLPTDCIAIDASDISLSATETEICEDEEVTLTASATPSGLTNPIYKWYRESDLSDVPVEGDELIVELDETTTFYVTVEANGYCFNTPGASIEITVNPLPDQPTISPDGALEICDGDMQTLTATASGADTYIWYKGGNEISGETSESIDVSDAGDYTVVGVSDKGCKGDESDSVTISVLDLPDTPTIDPLGPEEICEGEELELKASDAAGDEYRWYKDGVEIIEEIHQDPSDPTSPVIDIVYADSQTIKVTESGDYSVKVINPNGCESDLSAETSVTVNPKPEITVDGSIFISVAVDETVLWPNVTAELNGSSVPITWNDDQGDPTTLPTSFNAIGNYTYVAVAESSNACSAFVTVTVNVYDPEVCPPTMKRVYATNTDWGSIITGGVSNQNNAVDGNVKTYSTITTGVGALGVGTTWQTLYFDQTVSAGTPVTIKLGKEYSGLMLAGGLSVVGVKNGADIGVIQTVQGGLLDLLAADNVIEFTFVPSDLSGPQDYDAVRISQGALLSVAQNVKVYGAYYKEPGQLDCDPIDANTNSDVLDVLHGVQDLGLGVASATASVVDPWNAVDDDLNTSAKLVRGVSVLNAATLTVIFKQTVQPTDSLRILTKDITNHGVNLNLLTGYSFQRYMGETPVGDPIQGGDVLNLTLLYFSGDKQALMIDSYDEPYDRIQIASGSVVQAALSDQVEIFDVAVIPTITNEDDEKEFEVCQGDEIIIKQQDDCTTYQVFDENDNLLNTVDGYTFTVPENATPGTHTYTMQAMRDGCAIGPLQELEVTVNSAPELDGFDVSKNNDPVITYAPNDPIVEVDPNDELEVHAAIDWGTGGSVDDVVWEMQDPNDPNNWVTIPFGEVDLSTNDLTLNIPAYGMIEINGQEIDIRNTDVKIRVWMLSAGTCSSIEELTLRISGNSYMMSNPHIISKFKNN